MKYYLPGALVKEFLEHTDLGVKQFLIDRNYSASNPPQVDIPALSINIANQKQDYYLNNFYSTSGYLHVCVLLPDNDVDWSYGDDYLIKEQSFLYTIPDRIGNLLFQNVWKSEEMNYIAKHNSALVFPRGYNRSYTYNEYSSNMVSFDMSIGYRYIDDIQYTEPVKICGIKYGVVFDSVGQR